MSISIKLLSPSRAGFLFAALAATTMSFFSLDAMKREHNEIDQSMAIKAHHPLSPFEQELLPQEVTTYILSLALDCSTPEALLASIKKLRNSCITTLKTFAAALNINLQNKNTLKLDSLILASTMGDVDRIKIILCSNAYNTSNFITMQKENTLIAIQSDSGLLAFPNTPLHCAIKENDAEVVKLLIKGAKQEAWGLISAEPRSAFKMAQENKCLSILALFTKEYLKHQTRQLWSVGSSAPTEGTYNFLR